MPELAAPISTVAPSIALERRPPLLGRLGLTHSGIDVSRYTSMHVLGALFPVTAGIMFYGWRALASLLIVVGSTAIGVKIWQRVGRRGEQLRFDHAMWYALLLGLTLPAHLLSAGDSSGHSSIAAWPILPAAGLSLAIFIWILGGSGSGRIHPVLVVQLLMVVLFQDFLVPHYALQRQDLFKGDVLNAPMPAEGDRGLTPSRGLDNIRLSSSPAVWSEPASRRLETYTSGLAAPERSWTSLESLLRDEMPPLESLIIGGQPASIGSASAIAVIIGGLFLLYRGLIDYRIPLLIFAATFVCLLVLPIPTVISEDAEQWHWLAIRVPGVGGALAVTFADYEMMASPLLFAAFFLATAPAVRPMTRRARTIYAILIGVAAAIFQLYVSVSIGPYLALLAVSLATPTLDKVFTSKTLV